MMTPFIRGDTRLVALLGNPVAHSLSPQIHNHIFALCKLPYAYVPLPVPPEALGPVLFILRQCAFVGANVTIPHKQSVLPYCDDLSELARLTGAVNTLYFKNNLLCGDTTDAAGFLRALKAIGHDIGGGPVAIIGSGGIARSIGFALASGKLCPALTIIGRNPAKTAALVREIAQKTGMPAAACALDGPDLPRVLEQCSLLVNCTSVGMHPDMNTSPLPASLLRASMTVFDTVYNPRQTLLLKEAAAAGCKTENGLRMLLYQGLGSLKLWTGLDIAENLFDLTELQNSSAA
ncbi:MAG: shikimate dehydrogenase [Chitinivibrionales bacterium]|nr:shikimate dehydrogenase [Chitinivibrionales bacterium]